MIEKAERSLEANREMQVRGRSKLKSIAIFEVEAITWIFPNLVLPANFRLDAFHAIGLHVFVVFGLSLALNHALSVCILLSYTVSLCPECRNWDTFSVRKEESPGRPFGLGRRYL